MSKGRGKCKRCGTFYEHIGLLIYGYCKDCATKRIRELEEIYLGQMRVIARSRITYKEKVERMVALAEQALKG